MKKCLDPDTGSRMRKCRIRIGIRDETFRIRNNVTITGIGTILYSNRRKILALKKFYVKNPCAVRALFRHG
jgi:hypothetical protein